MSNIPTYIFVNIKATCGDKIEHQIREFDYEIIELSAIVFDSFGNLYNYIQIFTKPRINHILTETCKQITGIEQDWIEGKNLPYDSSWVSDIKLALEQFISWLNNFNNPIIFSYGNWDLNCMLPNAGGKCWVTIPDYLKVWCNLKLESSLFFNINSMRMNKMLEYLKIVPEERPNRYHYLLNGIKLVTKMIQSGYIPKITSNFNPIFIPNYYNQIFPPMNIDNKDIKEKYKNEEAQNNEIMLGRKTNKRRSRTSNKKKIDY